jgi:hypothetical protein
VEKDRVSVIFKPHPGAQTRFMSSTARYVLYGGAAGPGKTSCLIWDPFRQIMSETERVNRGEIKRSVGRAGLFRRTMPQLREILRRVKAEFRLVDPGVDWKEQDKTFTFSCGYEYLFGQMEDKDDWMNYYGFEFTWLGFDELTTFTEEQFDQLDTRVRTSDPVLEKQLYVRAGTNPVGTGLEWVKRRFYDIAPPNTPVQVKINVKVPQPDGTIKIKPVWREQIFIPAKLEDNPSVTYEEYAATLIDKSPAVRRALLEGDWNVSADAFFADLWDPSIHICRPFKIPAGWYRFRSCDYGYAYPGMASVQWWAVDPDGNMTCYRSYTCTRRNAQELAEDIQIIERDAGEWDTRRNCSTLTGPMDSSCWGDAGHVGPTIAETMMECGVHWFKCTKDRKGMADQMRIRLKSRKPHPTVKDDKGEPAWIVPGIRWFDTCISSVYSDGGKKIRVGPIVTIPVLPSDEDDHEKWDTKASDHDADSAGYACMSRPIMGLDEKVDINGRKHDRIWDDDELAPRRRAGRMGYGGW